MFFCKIRTYGSLISGAGMQLRLPIFPPSIKLITPHLGVLEDDEIVTYFHCGAPIFNHGASDLRSFRYITSKFIDGGLCKGTEISRCFGVSIDSVRRSLRLLRSEGEDGFFGAENRHGHSYKLVGSLLIQAQKLLDSGWNNSRIARELGIREGTVRYGIKTGKLKKKVP